MGKRIAKILGLILLGFSVGFLIERRKVKEENLHVQMLFDLLLEKQDEGFVLYGTPFGYIVKCDRFGECNQLN